MSKEGTQTFLYLLRDPHTLFYREQLELEGNFVV